MNRAFRSHWPEYLIEGAALGAFMLSALFFTALFEYPDSPAHALISNPAIRRALIGLAMGLTALSLIYSPWGQRSGAHMNPAVTLSFWHLGKIAPVDAVFYILAQFTGGTCGILLSKILVGQIVTHPSVNYVVTVPGGGGALTALIAEAALSFGMMLTVLTVSNTPKLARYTGLFASSLVFLFITFEAPLSGMSINPARTVASALPSGIWNAVWIYFAGPISGMLLAAVVFRSLRHSHRLACPKLFHGVAQRCIFCGHLGAQFGGPSKTDDSRPSSQWHGQPNGPTNPIRQRRMSDGSRPQFVNSVSEPTTHP